MIPVNWHQSRGYWDQALLEDIFKDSRFTHDMESEGSIYVVSGEYTNAKEVNEIIKKWKWVILIVTSDEQSRFAVEKIRHPNIRVWIMYPKQGRHDDYDRLPLGYTPHTRENLELVDKDLDFFFSGQVTHKRREECVKHLSNVENGLVCETEGFTQGLEPKEYIGYMNRAKTAPAPSGPVCADSFRCYEALEAGAVPIADNRSLAGDRNYFKYLFENPAFPTLDHYQSLPGYIEDQVKEYPAKNNRVQAWWLRYKKQLKQRIIDQVTELTGVDYTPHITVVVPVSPIKSHPSTEILEMCIKTVKIHLPKAEIIITFDGVRDEQEERRSDYEEFIRRALFLANTEWDAIPYIFDDHTHQVGMLRAVIDKIKTPTILYVEGDTGLTPDIEIDFKYCIKKILDGTSNLIRFHFESRIPEEHEHLMLAKEGKLLETIQWSQRPHLASTAYYKRILKEHFSENAKSFIEDKMHGVVADAYNTDKRQGWLQHRLHIYAPEDNIKRSVDFDGREGEKKYDDSQIF